MSAQLGMSRQKGNNPAPVEKKDITGLHCYWPLSEGKAYNKRGTKTNCVMRIQDS